MVILGLKMYSVTKERFNKKEHVILFLKKWDCPINLAHEEKTKERT